MDPVPVILSAARELRASMDTLRFAPPVACVYNPLDYAWDLHAAYVRRFGVSTKRVVFLGMNPGPYGMAQTGIPFGEVAAVRDWLRLEGTVLKPAVEHPRRPVEGLNCARSEVSGRRLWGLFSERFGRVDAFFEDHFVVNYCPLVFMTESGANLTPDKLPARETEPLLRACDLHLRRVVEVLRPKWVVGVGGFAAARAAIALAGVAVEITRILHPSPASPAANKDWAGQATKALESAGVWPRHKANTTGRGHSTSSRTLAE